MKLISAEQKVEVYKDSIVSESNNKQLSARIAKEIFKVLRDQVNKESEVQIYCGLAGNGVDGLALAQELSYQKIKVKAYITRYADSESDDFKEMFKQTRAMMTVPIYEISEKTSLPEINSNTIVVDALIGTGRKEEIEDDTYLAKVITHINENSKFTLSIDLPTGLHSELPTNGVSIAADMVVALERPALSLLMPDNIEFAKKISIANIGLNHEFIESLPSQYFLTDFNTARELFVNRVNYTGASKDDFGYAYLVVGGINKYGAGLMAITAATRSGVGRVAAHIPSSISNAALIRSPEAMISSDPNPNILTEIPYNSRKFDAVGIGPGIGVNQLTVDALDSLFEKSDLDTKLILDADALNILAKNPDMIEMIPPGSILTPHKKEFERLVGKWTTDNEMLDNLRGFTRVHNVVVILKGKYSIVALPSGKLHFNYSGNPGMATAGSGDVLLGLLTGLVAQGYIPEEAAILGTYIHGLAGDIAASKKGLTALAASDLITYLPDAFMRLETHTK